ncbi:hypothetical protein [Vacuolonema iberomarrocanum]|uniref:hypothetical protein n=1 Tax=Vacuolonema iberomarrocanum TaxID=3454632 RepID=UPI0019ECF13B|nr:hypothetical protein [filamentous cyanobacterium LEGE 07170]
MNRPIHVQSHVEADGTLYIEGLHQIANQDVTVILTPQIGGSEDTAFELEKYAVSVTGKSVADRIKTISQICSSLPILDDRSADEILDYNDIGVPE